MLPRVCHMHLARDREKIPFRFRSDAGEGLDGWELWDRLKLDVSELREFYRGKLWDAVTLPPLFGPLLGKIPFRCNLCTFQSRRKLCCAAVGRTGERNGDAHGLGRDVLVARDGDPVAAVSVNLELNQLGLAP